MPARPDETLDYTGIWKVSSEPCSVSGTVTIGHDPQEIAPKITMPTAYCAASTATCTVSMACNPACASTEKCCSPTLAGGPYCAASTATCTASTACTPACTGTDICCLPGLCSDETEVIFH